MNAAEVSLLQQIAECDQILFWIPKILEEIRAAAEENKTQYYLESSDIPVNIWHLLEIELENLGYSVYGKGVYGFTVAWP